MNFVVVVVFFLLFLFIVSLVALSASQFPEAKKYQLSDLISPEKVNDKYIDFLLIGTGYVAYYE
jgi:hypothetical protein